MSHDWRPSPGYFKQRGKGHASKGTPAESGYYARGPRHGGMSEDGRIWVEVRVNSVDAIAKVEKTLADLRAFAHELKNSLGSVANVDVKLDPSEANQALISTGAAFSEMIANKIAENARHLAPVDTGRLRDSIVVASLARGTGSGVLVDVPYAEWVEFGHLSVLGGNFIPPNPFFRNAIFMAIDQAPMLAGNLTLGRHSISERASISLGGGGANGMQGFTVEGMGDLGFF